jgi:hypothetical protein
MSKVIDINMNTTTRIPITMVIVDKDDLIVDGVDGLQVGTTVGDRLKACTEEGSSQMGVDPG